MGHVAMVEGEAWLHSLFLIMELLEMLVVKEKRFYGLIYHFLILSHLFLFTIKCPLVNLINLLI